MAQPPHDFDRIVWESGKPLLKAATRSWTKALAGLFRAVSVAPADNGQVVAQYTADGTVLHLSRPIPEVLWGHTTGGSIPAKDGATGQWGSGEVTLYDTTIVAGEPRDALGEVVVVGRNRGPNAVPNGVDVILVEQGGDFLVIGWYCPGA